MSVISMVVVTGACGFIGTTLVDSLRRAGYDVFPAGRDMGDVTEPAFWNSLPRAKHVVHLAGRSYVPDSWDGPADFYAKNVVGAAHAVEYCRRTAAHLLFVSSYVYGNPQRLPIDENHPLAPGNPYALSKVLAEQVCAFHAEAERLAVTIVRPFNVFGPGQRTDFLIPAVIDQIKRGGDIWVKDVRPRRDYLFIDDLAAGLVRTLRSPEGLRVFNLGSGSSYSVGEVIDMAQMTAGTRFEVRCEEAPRKNEIADVRADITRARMQLGWEPHVSLRQGLELMLAASMTK
jgi:GDP-4-dehydro-6-deoxy-D-mannose reductase